MAEKISDEHAIIAAPGAFIERAVKYAKNLGMYDSQSSVMAIPGQNLPRPGNERNGGQPQEYKGYFKSRICPCNAPGNVTKADCVCYNSKIVLSSDASKGAKAYVKLNRLYLVLKPRAKLLEVDTKSMRVAVDP